MAERDYAGRLMRVYESARLYMAAHTRNPYHNFGHAMDVACAADTLGRLERIGLRERNLLLTAAFLHDAYNVRGDPLNEEISAGLARYITRRAGYDDEERRMVSGLILATRMPTSPEGRLQELICDADLWNLQGYDFMGKGELLRQEWGIPDGREWYRRQLDLLLSHRYYTESARALGKEGLDANRRRLEQRIEATYRSRVSKPRIEATYRSRGSEQRALGVIWDEMI